MKSFVKIMCLTLALLMAASVAIACTDEKDENTGPIITERTTTAQVTTTAGTTTEQVTTTELTTTEAPITTTAAPTTTTGDGFGPLIPLETTKKQ